MPNEELKLLLQSAAENVKKNSKKSESESEEILFQKIYQSIRPPVTTTSTTTTNGVPAFYVKPPDETDFLRQKLREETRAEFLQRRSRV